MGKAKDIKICGKYGEWKQYIYDEGKGRKGSRGFERSKISRSFAKSWGCTRFLRLFLSVRWPLPADQMFTLDTTSLRKVINHPKLVNISPKIWPLMNMIRVSILVITFVLRFCCIDEKNIWKFAVLRFIKSWWCVKSLHTWWNINWKIHRTLAIAGHHPWVPEIKLLFKISYIFLIPFPSNHRFWTKHKTSERKMSNYL